MNYLKLLYLLLFIQLTAMANDSLLIESRRIAKENIIIDTHIDLPLRLMRYQHDVSERINHGHIDYPRAMEGGLNIAFMAIYTSSSLEMNGAKDRADSLIALVEQMSERHPDKFSSLYSTNGLKDNFIANKLYLPLGMENGAPIEGDIKNLIHFYNKGIRYITLCHTKNNHICDSSGDPERKWNGLSPFGELVIKEMNRIGIMVDVSHISDSSFYDVLKITSVPVIASHSGCRAFTPGFERNMSDEMIKALAENGGVIQIYFGSTLLNNSLREAFDLRTEARERYFKEHDHLSQEEIKKQFNTAYPLKKGPIDDVVKHIDHVVKLVGIDHVGIGSDFDGLEVLADGLEDASKYPNLIYELLILGYSEQDIKKILHGNILRVWEKAETYAEENRN
jgi:membrane dipeptidase